jgi:phosphate-selective porin OprO and OprP
MKFAVFTSLLALPAAAAGGLDEWWEMAVLHREEAHPFLQLFKLRGRYHGQFHAVDAAQGRSDGWEDRRSRFGFDAHLFARRLEMRVDFQSNDGFEDPYDRLIDAYLRWRPSASLSLKVGRMQPVIGWHDWLQSSNAQPTLERSQLFNQLNVNWVSGGLLEGSREDFNWRAGIYSNQINREFGHFNASWSASLGAGHDFSKSSGFELSEMRVDWLHSDRVAETNILGRYDDIVSATLRLGDGVWGLVAEGFHASGGSGANGDAVGGYLLATYDLVPEKLQLVARGSLSVGEGPQSLRRQTRYESRVVDARGDRYRALYLGAQVFFRGDQLKLLGGVEYARLSGGPAGREFDGFTWLGGVRFSF